MLHVDYRAGSKELISPLAKVLGFDPKEMETTLDFGDVAFTGRGPNDLPLDIGIEFKTLGDITQCCRDGRFAGHQLPGMRKTYDHSWLLVEGNWKMDASGLMNTYQGKRGWRPIPGKMRASEFEKHMLTFELCGGVHIRYTNTRADSVRVLVDMYRWWTDKTMDSHTSHIAIHTPPAIGATSDFRKAVMAWPGIGSKTSKSVEKFFNGNLKAAVMLNAAEWAEIETDGRRFGRPAADRLMHFFRGVK